MKCPVLAAAALLVAGSLFAQGYTPKLEEQRMTTAVLSSYQIDIEDVEYLRHADKPLLARLFKPRGAGPFPLVVELHGGAWCRGDRRNDGKQDLQLRLVRANGTDDRALTDNLVFNWCPFWHPSGKCLIFTQADHAAPSKGGKINYDLFLMNKHGEDLTRITYAPAFDGLPVFSPDGKRLMWTSKRGGLKEPQVFIADIQVPHALTISKD